METGGSAAVSDTILEEGDLSLEELQNRYHIVVGKAAHQATTLYSITEPSSFSEKLTLASLQGLAAASSEEQIIITTGTLEKYRSILTEKYGAKFVDHLDGEKITTANIISHYAGNISGYIICEDSPDSDSVNVAISLAGLLNAVIVTEGQEKDVTDAGLTCLLDVRGKDDAWLRQSEYFDQLSKDIAFEQPASMAPKLVDYAVLNHAYFSFYSGHDSNAHMEKYDFLNDNAYVFGYNNTLGEYDTVASFSKINICMVPADHAINLATLSGFCEASARQKTKEVSDGETGNVHTVCLIMSDGDNMQWLVNDFISSDKWFSSDIRGSFDMGWGLPATAIDVTAPIVDYLYDTMSESDEFIMQLSGLGYTFPSKWDSSARMQMAEVLAEYMKRSDLHYAEILDDGGFNSRFLSAFTGQDGIEGLFYIDYSNYAGCSGGILWSDGKPVVSARYRLWNNTADGSIKAISKMINMASADPHSPDAYSFIIVHAWSGLDGNGNLVEGGNTMQAVQALVESFDSHVEVVTPSEFMTRVIANLSE